MAGLRWPAAITLTSVLLLCSLLLLIMRALLERRHYHPNASTILSLVFVFLAWLCFLASFAVTVWRGHQALQHADHEKDALWMRPLDVPQGHLENVLKMVVLELFMVPTAVWLVKCSLLALLYGVADRVGKRQRRLLWALTAVVAGSWATVVASQAFVCRPFKRQWSLDPTSYCSPTTHPLSQLLSALLSILSNVLCSIYTLTTFAPSAMPPADRHALYSLVGLVALASAAAIARAALLSCTSVLAMSPEALNLVAVLSRAELGLSLAAVSWPTLRGMLETTLFAVDASMGLAGASGAARDVRRRAKVPGKDVEFCTSFGIEEHDDDHDEARIMGRPGAAGMGMEMSMGMGMGAYDVDLHSLTISHHS
ncbi:hypothetical protein EDC01DRAFT_346107 [Geopyxis carbonaria]|nr:hypothetical protein EDC01DRAFT_346107 [Geopyxis carbonaria]